MRLRVARVALTASCFVLSFPVPNSPVAGAAQTAPEESGLTLRITTREVLLDVVALDGHGRPLLDLRPQDLEIFETGPHGQKLAGKITSLRLYDPSTFDTGSGEGGTGFLLTRPVRCLDRATPHYILAYRPSNEGWKSGFHSVLLNTGRHGARLFYQREYYVGQKESSPELEHLDPRKIEKAIRDAACDHPASPPSILLRAERVLTSGAGTLRYAVAMDPDSLAFVPMASVGHRLQLDYGACSFDIKGKPLDLLRATTDRVLTSQDYAQVQEHGLRAVFEIPAAKNPAMIRFAVRDRATGNIGIVSAITPATDRGQAESFGSIVPRAHGFCGDVYKLDGFTMLPDFRNLEPLGAVYANSIMVPYQPAPASCAIPGVSCNAAFGVDYHGTFWIVSPGQYQFEVTSDDGSRMEIDGTQIIDNDGSHDSKIGLGQTFLAAGRHTMRVSYFENGEGFLTLELRVRPPGGEWRTFDMRDFAPGAEAVKDPSP